MLLTVIIFLSVLSLLVLVHELGHFLAARKFGVRVDEFGFGLPPRLFGIKRGETVYSLNWLPIGGFVKLYGEDEEKETKGPDSFFAKPKKIRAAILTAGVLMNFLLAILVISYIFTQGVLVPTDKVFVKEVSPGSPAEKAGLKIDDNIIKCDQKIIKTPEELISYTKQHFGEEVVLEIERCDPLYPRRELGQLVSCQHELVKIIPRKDAPKNEGAMGMAISNLVEKKYSLVQAPFLGTAEAFRLSWLMVSEIGKILFKVITFQPVKADIAGPLGIAQATGQAVKFGAMAVLQLLGLLSLNLAVVNILPFPALDGGRLLFIGIEALTGKRVKPYWERWVHQIGMMLLLSLLALVTINDVLRILGR
jgi:regulator of sigma E protease